MLGKLFNLSTPRKVWGYWREIQANLKHVLIVSTYILIELYTHIISSLMLHDHVMVCQWQCWQCLVMNYNHTPIADMHLQKTHVN